MVICFVASRSRTWNFNRYAVECFVCCGRETIGLGIFSRVASWSAVRALSGVFAQFLFRSSYTSDQVRIQLGQHAFAAFPVVSLHQSFKSVVKEEELTPKLTRPVRGSRKLVGKYFGGTYGARSVDVEPQGPAVMELKASLTLAEVLGMMGLVVVVLVVEMQDVLGHHIAAPENQLLGIAGQTPQWTDMMVCHSQPATTRHLHREMVFVQRPRSPREPSRATFSLLQRQAGCNLVAVSWGRIIVTPCWPLCLFFSALDHQPTRPILRYHPSARSAAAVEDERVFELFGRHIGLECSWLNADDGLSIYMAVVKILSISNINQ
ncbi:hypothetical protein KCU76_g44, partial [Aureobasidium melanogenum]